MRTEQIPRRPPGITQAVSKEVFFKMVPTSSFDSPKGRAGYPACGQPRPRASETLPAFWPFYSSLTPLLRGQRERSPPSVNMTNGVLSSPATVDPLPAGQAESASTSLSGGQQTNVTCPGEPGRRLRPHTAPRAGGGRLRLHSTAAVLRASPDPPNNSCQGSMRNS